jgi:hypothetical protein
MMNPDKGVLTLLVVISVCAMVHLAIYLIYVAE